MSSKISKISELPKKHHSPWFANKYSREQRENIELNPDNISADMKEFYPPNSKNTFYSITVESPFDGFIHNKELNLYDAVINCNSLLIYRLLKLMYGDADVVGAFIDISKPDNPKKIPADWSYILRLDNDLVAEIRSLFMNTKHVVRFWTDILPKENMNIKGADIIGRFGEDLNKAVSNNLHLFSEKEEFKKTDDTIPSIFENSFATKYKSAEQFLDMAQSIDNKPKRKTLQWDEKLEVRPSGSIYMASALFYIIAIETLLNIFYKIFLCDEYKQYPYERVTEKADLEIRLSTIHLFCSCFTRHVVPPKSELWKNISLLRELRNDLVHGNITSEHYVHSLIEDNMLFAFSPITDFRGQLEEKKENNVFPRVMSSMGKDEVILIKGMVDDLIQNLLNAMDDASRTWVESWLYELGVPTKKFHKQY